MHKALLTYFILLVFSFMQLKANDNTYYHENENKLYKEAVNFLKKKRYRQATKALQKIENLYPFSSYAMKALLLRGISHFNMKDYSNAISAAENYINVHPNSKDLSYVHYLRVISYYMQIRKTQFDQQKAHKTLELAKEYISIFPYSKYIEEIKKKIEIVEDHMMSKEYYIGKYYLRRGKYLAAIKRFQGVVKNRESKYFLKSINYLIAIYSALGLSPEVQGYKNIIVESFKKK